MIKAYIKKISDFAQKNGIDHLRVLDNLMDYIIGFLSPVALVNKSWNYSPSQNESFYGLMIDYFKLCEIEMGNHVIQPAIEISFLRLHVLLIYLQR